MGVVRTIRSSLKSTHEIFICEMGARHVGDIKEICDIVHPHHGVITSVGPQHLETFFNMENIKNTKFELADALPKDSFLFLNGDNEYIQEKAAAYDNKIFYHSEGATDGYYAKDIKLSQLGTEFTVVAPNGESERFQMKLIGSHNVINVVGAIAVANTLGIALADLKIPVRRIMPVEHRMQMREHGAVTIIDDAYNSNPVGSKAAVETLAMFDGTRILITPGMVELGKEHDKQHKEVAKVALDTCDVVIAVVPERIKTFVDKFTTEKSVNQEIILVNTLAEARKWLSANSKRNDVILYENDLPDVFETKVKI